MRLTIAALGWSFDLCLEPVSEAVEGSSLDGGTTASDVTTVSLGPSDMFMGFTNGREGCVDPEDGGR